MVTAVRRLSARAFLVAALVYAVFYFLLWHVDFPLLTTRRALYRQCPTLPASSATVELDVVRPPLVAQRPRLAVCMTGSLPTAPRPQLLAGGVTVLPYIWPTMHRVFLAMDAHYLIFLHVSNYERPSAADLAYMSAIGRAGRVRLSTDVPMASRSSPRSSSSRRRPSYRRCCSR